MENPTGVLRNTTVNYAKHDNYERMNMICYESSLIIVHHIFYSICSGVLTTVLFFCV